MCCILSEKRLVAAFIAVFHKTADVSVFLLVLGAFCYLTCYLTLLFEKMKFQAATILVLCVLQWTAQATFIPAAEAQARTAEAADRIKVEQINKFRSTVFISIEDIIEQGKCSVTVLLHYGSGDLFDRVPRHASECVVSEIKELGYQSILMCGNLYWKDFHPCAQDEVDKHLAITIRWGDCIESD